MTGRPHRPWALHWALLWLAALIVPTALDATPLPTPMAPPAPILERDLARVMREVRDPAVFNAASCATYLLERTQAVLEHGTTHYLPQDQREDQTLMDAAPRLAQDLFDFRVTLTDRLGDLARHRDPDPACVTAVIRALRYARFIEELLVEWWLGRTPAGGPYPVLAGPRPVLMVSRGEGAYQPRSGDILLARNDSFVSAAIARISDEEGQFSHAALVQVDAAGQVWVLESLIQRGAVATPWAEWTAHPPVRVLVKRHPDAATAARAADWLHRWIDRRFATGADPAPYDFFMNFGDDAEFSCSELVRFAYRESSGGQTRLPRFASSLGELAQHPFVQALGIRQPTLYSPSDFETDPNLVTVAEWRDYSRTAHSRIQDAILTSIFRWMTDKRYALTYRGLRQGLGNLYWEVLRPTGLGARWVQPNMTRGFFTTILALRSVTRGLEQELVALDDRQRRRTGWGLDYQTMLTRLEELRRQDCAAALAKRREARASPFLSEPPLGAIPLLFHQYLDVPAEVGDCPER